MATARWRLQFAAVGLAVVTGCGGGDPADHRGDMADAADEVPVRSASARDTVEGRIAAAEAEGRIDRETALTLRVFALYGDARLPGAYRHDAPPAADDEDVVDEVDGNAVLAELAGAWDGLSEATRRVLEPFRGRPTEPGSWLDEGRADGPRRAAAAAQPAARPTCASNAGGTWGFIAPATAKVRIWYLKSRAADLTQARTTSAAFETQIWPKLITGLGFKAPLSDAPLACDGGDARLDVYIVASLGARGATVAESASVRQSSTYLLLRSGLTGAQLTYTATHQFMHAVQWSYLMAAAQTSYGWMRNALANWAVEAVYPGNATLLADASCHLNSTFLPITSLSTGACSTSTTRTRDYGAYLLYQYIGRTSGNAKVRELLAATATATTALGAIDTQVSGGLRALWPKYAKTLWNQPPVTGTGRPAYRNWDGLTAAPALAPDRPTTVNANLGGLSEASTTLSASTANVSTRFYRFTFSEAATRTLMFRNTYYALAAAGKKVTVQAMWRTEAGTWAEENWSLKEWIGLCRDVKAQRVVEVVVVVASGEVGAVTQAAAATAPTFKRNNIGCWGWSGSAKRTDVVAAWTSGTNTLTSSLLFDYKPNAMGTVQYNDASRLRVPIAAPLFRRASWVLAESYVDAGCTYLLNASGTDTTIVLGGLGFGSLVINNFAESLPASLRTQQQGVVGSARGAYHIDAGSQRFGLVGTVTGPQPDCGTQYTSAPAMFVLTNASPGGAPVIQLNGHLKGSFVSSASPDSVVFSWDLAPMREP